MKKILFKTTVLAIALLVVGCNADEIINKSTDTIDRPSGEGAFTVVASVPDNGATPRVALERDDEAGEVVVTWKAGDQIVLHLVQDENSATLDAITLTADDLSNGGKVASFAFDLPSGFDEGQPFTLYGVHGSGTVTDTQITLPTGSGASLADVQDDLILYFSRVVDPADGSLTVQFNHLGSIFNITLENKSDDVLDATGGIKLAADGGEDNWAYSSGTFDFVSQTISGTPTDKVIFNVPGNEIAANSSVTVLKWLPILAANELWPELAVEVGSTSRRGTKGARAAAAGKNYLLSAEWNGKLLSFGSAVNPLARWADYDLGALNTFAGTDPDLQHPGTTIGNLYQFGRNVPLDPGFFAANHNPVVTGVATPADPLVWTWTGKETAIYRNTNVGIVNENWFPRIPGRDNDLLTWKNVVAESATGGAPESYIGTNNGDPCPPGWHVPHVSEARSLVFGTVIANWLNFLGSVPASVNETGIDVLGNSSLANYLAEYKRINSETIVGLRFKDTNYASAYLYKLVNFSFTPAADQNTYMEVRSQLVPHGTAISQIEGWTEADWAGAEVRYFPIIGRKHYIYADALFGINWNWRQFAYWTSTADNYNNGQVFGVTYIDQANSYVFRLVGTGRAEAGQIRCVRD